MKLPLNLYRFTLRARDEIVLPEYAGATIRGAFGCALKKAMCTRPGKPCGDCLLSRHCGYPFVFEPGPAVFGVDTPARFRDLPRPFVLRPPRRARGKISAGENIDFELVLFGRAIELLPYFVYAFHGLGETGLGAGRGRFLLERVADFTGVVCYEKDGATVLSGTTHLVPGDAVDREVSSLSVHFLSPTRIKSGGRLRANPDFYIFFQGLLSRLTMLNRLYSDNSPVDDVRGLLALARDVRRSWSRLHWYDWSRFSTRQKTRMNLGGFTGRIVFEGGLAPFLPYLVLGQYTHVGKGCTFGLGQYSLGRKGSTLET